MAVLRLHRQLPSGSANEKHNSSLVRPARWSSYFNRERFLFNRFKSSCVGAPYRFSHGKAPFCFLRSMLWASGRGFECTLSVSIKKSLPLLKLLSVANSLTPNEIHKPSCAWLKLVQKVGKTLLDLLTALKSVTHSIMQSSCVRSFLRMSRRCMCESLNFPKSTKPPSN